MQTHGYSLFDLENMLPWEREIYLTLLIEDQKKKREEMQKLQMGR